MIPYCPLCQSEVSDWKRPYWDLDTFKACPKCDGAGHTNKYPRPAFFYRYQDDKIMDVNLECNEYIITSIYWFPRTLIHLVEYKTNWALFDSERAQDIPKTLSLQELIRLDSPLSLDWFNQPISPDFFKQKCKFLLAFQ